MPDLKNRKYPQGRVVLITGAAQGLGAAAAYLAAKFECRVVLVDRDEQAVQAAALYCQTVSPHSVALVIDLRERDAASRMIERTLDVAGRLDVLINGAAIAPVEPFLAMTETLWDSVLEINVRAVALAMSAAGNAMRAQGGGHIINVTSAAARMAQPSAAAYSASKAAVDALTRTAAVALAPYNIRVNSFSPGMMDTPLQERLESSLYQFEHEGDIATFKAQRTARIPLGRRTDPEEMAKALIWLALDSPAYMTAERFNVSGGLDKD